MNIYGQSYGRSILKLVIVILFFIVTPLYSQSCFTQLDDISGIDTSPFQADLENASCELREALPEEYRSEFQVYDFGNYSFDEFTNDGTVTIWEKVRADVTESSEFYLLFFKVSNQNGVYSEIYVDFNLPDVYGDCFSEKDAILAQMNRIVNNDLQVSTYASNEISAMNQFLSLTCEICDNGLDDDNDGYIDCYDLDCSGQNSNITKDSLNSNRSNACYNLPEECLSPLRDFISDPGNNEWLQNNFSVLDWGRDFLSQFGCTSEIRSYVISAFKLKQTDPLINLGRVEELFIFVRDNPNGLVAGCPDFDLQTYSDLLNLQIPGSILDKLASEGTCYEHVSNGTNMPPPPVPRPCFEIQGINDVSKSLINIDYFAVEILDMPDFNRDQIPDSPEEVYERFRNDFTSLSSGSTTVLTTQTNCYAPGRIDATWEFMPYDDSDIPLYDSRIIGARFFIDAGANFPNSFVADDGAIITIQENDFNFIAATIYTPRSESQPFSGNRMWGIRLNENGNYEIFTRGIDTARPLMIISLLGLSWLYPDCDEKDYFDIAKRTWSSMQLKVRELIQQNDGLAVEKVPSIKHLSYKKVYNKLKSSTPVNFISCY